MSMGQPCQQALITQPETSASAHKNREHLDYPEGQESPVQIAQRPLVAEPPRWMSQSPSAAMAQPPQEANDRARPPPADALK